MDNDNEVEYQCTNCGEAVGANDKYCTKCGADVSEIQGEVNGKKINIKRIFTPGRIILSIFIAISVFYYAFKIYTEYRIQNPPHVQIALEVNIPLYLQNLAKNKDNNYQTIMEEVDSELKTNQNKDVFELVQKKFSQKQIPMNRYFGDINDNNNNIIASLREMTIKALDSDEEIIRNRLAQYEMVEPSIRKQGNWRIIVEFPVNSSNEYTEKEIRQLLLGTGLLEFKLIKDPEFTFSIMKKIDDLLFDSPNKNTRTTNWANRGLNEKKFNREHPFFSIVLLDPNGKTADAYVIANDKDKLERMLARPEVQEVIPDNAEFDYSATPVAYQNGIGVYLLFCVNKKPELTGSVITNAQAYIDPVDSFPAVNIQMNSEGTTEWARITYYNVGKRLAVIMDGAVYTAPIIKGKILQGNSQITGMASLEEAKILEVILSAGSLAAPIKIVSQNILEK